MLLQATVLGHDIEIGLHNAHMHMQVNGDAFIGRTFDNGDDFKRLDFRASEVSSSAVWVQVQDALTAPHVPPTVGTHFTMLTAHCNLQQDCLHDLCEGTTTDLSCLSAALLHHPEQLVLWHFFRKPRHRMTGNGSRTVQQLWSLACGLHSQHLPGSSPGPHPQGKSHPQRKFSRTKAMMH